MSTIDFHDIKPARFYVTSIYSDGVIVEFTCNDLEKCYRTAIWFEWKESHLTSLKIKEYHSPLESNYSVWYYLNFAESQKLKDFIILFSPQNRNSISNLLSGFRK